METRDAAPFGTADTGVIVSGRGSEAAAAPGRIV